MGRKSTNLGKRTITRYGRLIPKPIEIKINNNVNEFCVNAAVIAVPINGAEQGVAKSVAKNPLKKFLAKKLLPWLKKFEVFIEDGRSISNNPSVFKENIVNTNKINIKKYGSWNCIPHDTEKLNCLRIRKNIANNKNENSIPNVV